MNIFDMVKPSGRFEKLDDDLDDLEFCIKVYDGFVAGERKPTVHMDVVKAQEQLLDAVRRVLRRGL